MASRALIAVVATGGLLTAAAGFAAADGGTRIPGVYDPRASALEELAAKLQAEQRSLDRRAQSIEGREAELKGIEQKLDQRAAELDKMRKEIEALQEKVDEQHAERVASIVKTVEAMKPQPAAGLIEKLDPSLAIEVVRSMAPSKAAKLLAALPPVLGAKITEGVAGPGCPVGARSAGG